MHERHKNRDQYFKEQSITTKKYVLPYGNEFMKIDQNTRVLEIGCGKGGNLLPFLELGCSCVGIYISEG
ncbi:MAG TPA: class I SAM-dependent methyltransferase, partial [Saprospiraceae bacterium]|nr:class I SAM-dependent methyltransferase [Saprospiraceae bacterium]